MVKNPKLEEMVFESSDTPSSSCKASELGKMGTQIISVSDQTNSSEVSNFKSDSFILDMDRFSHLTDKDVTPNSRITLQRSFSRKMSQQRGSEKKNNPSIGNEYDNSIGVTSSPRGGGSTPEKPMMVRVGTTDHGTNPRVQHQITIMSGNIGANVTDSRCSGKRSLSFRRFPPSWAIDPRRVLLFFATLSSMGTILLIYFTLSIGKPSGDDSAQNW